MPPRQHTASEILDSGAPIVSAVTILDRLLGVTPVTQAAAGSPVHDVPVGTAATSEGALRELDPYAAAAFGIPVDSSDNGPVTRETAMRVPDVRRGRNLIAGTIATLPLVCYRRGTTAEVIDRHLLRVLDPRTTPAYTIAQTVDDLFFHGIAWWRVTARDSTDYPAEVEWLAKSRVQVIPATSDKMGRVLVDGHEADDRDLIRFDALDGGILRDGGADVIRLALALARASKRVADDDWSGLILRLVEGATELSTAPNTALDGGPRSRVQEFLDGWMESRRERSTGYLNGAVTAENVGVNASDRQLTELAQLVATQLANMMNLPTSRTGAPSGDSMTYSSTESDRREMADTTLAPFLTVIYQRLSMGDVTPMTQAVVWDLTAYLRGTVTELVTAGTAAVDKRLATPHEVRTTWLGLPPRADVLDTFPEAPAPAAPATREDTPA